MGCELLLSGQQLWHVLPGALGAPSGGHFSCTTRSRTGQGHRALSFSHRALSPYNCP